MSEQPKPATAANPLPRHGNLEYKAASALLNFVVFPFVAEQPKDGFLGIVVGYALG